MKVNFTIVLSAACWSSLSACVAPDSLPGDSLGKYDVVAKLVKNTCGSGIDASNPWRFSAEMSKDDGTLYLATDDGSDEISGGYDDSDETSATLVAAVTENVNGTNASATIGTTCNLTLATTYTLTLGDTSPPQEFSGSATYEYSVASSISSNTDCSAQLSTAGGKYATLPCTVAYSLEATRR